MAPELTLHTFTAGFGADDGGLVAAGEVAHHFGTVHHEVVLAPDDLPELLPHVVWHMEDPIGREEMVFWYLISREAAKHVPLLLCGNLSDLLFAGMPRFIVPKAAAAPAAAQGRARGVLQLHPERDAALVPARPAPHQRPTSGPCRCRRRRCWGTTAASSRRVST